MAKKNNKKPASTKNDPNKQHFALKEIQPLTENQEKVFGDYDDGKNLLIHGYAGTGKTYISLYLALESILTGKSNYDKIIIIRSVVPSRDMGFLPGTIAEKSKVYEEPYKEICDNLFGRGDGYDLLKMRGIIHFTTTSFLRGMTFNNAIVIVDEMQNNTFSENNTILTRMGDNSRIIMCGDFRQTDLDKSNRYELNHFMNILKRIPSFGNIEFTQDDIVRSGLVKSYIIQSTKYIEEHSLDI